MANFSKKLPCLAFRWSFQQKVAKSASFCEKARQIVNLVKTLQLWEQATMSLHFDELFRKKLQKVPRFVKKHEKSSIWPKLRNFSSKLPCLGISMKFSGKICKQCLISWKSTRNHGVFQQNLVNFFLRTSMSLHFDEVFRKKLQKLPHFLKKHEKSSISAKLLSKTSHFSKNHRFGQN